MGNVRAGTTEWFLLYRHRCVDHLRALASIRLAHDYMTRVLDLWASADAAILGALHSASIVAYARPFTSAATKHGKVTYGAAGLKKVSGFDRQLHEHLLMLRNQLIAHADYAYFPSTMYLQNVGDEQLPVAIGINVKIMVGLRSRSLAERYRSHFLACMTAIEAALNRDLKELVAQAKEHPAEFDTTHNLPTATAEWSVTPEFSTLPPPAGPAGGVDEPTFPETGDYVYLTLQHQMPLINSGTYMIH